MPSPAISPSPAANQPEPIDRVLAVAAYLGYLVGLWLLAPIAVYLLRRRRSRFAAHHAAQAAVLHLLLGLLLTVAVLLVTIVGGVVMVLADGTGVNLLLWLAWTSWLLPAGLHLGLTCLAAARAGRGRIDLRSRPGRAAEWLLAQDPGVAPPAEQ